MIPTWSIPWLLIALPCLGALSGLAAWSKPERLKTHVLTATAGTFLAIVTVIWWQGDLSTGKLFVCLLPVASFISLLGQPVHRDNRSAWVLSLILLGLGLGSLIAPEPARQVSRIFLLSVVAAAMHRFRGTGPAPAVRAVACYGIGIIAAVAALVLPPSSAAIASLVTCATLLPLLPLHAGHVAVLTRLPGNLPALLIVLLPVVGLQQIPALLPDLSPSIRQALEILALVGAFYGSLQALTQVRPLPLLAYASVAFFSILWWVVAVTGAAGAQAGIYVSAVGLASSGLLLAWYAVRARYGDVDLRALGGMVYAMPRFSTLLCLLALAALGMPPFGVFAGFLGMLFDPAFKVSGGLAIVLFAWLSASWYLLGLMQQLVFGRRQSTVPYDDLRTHEFVSLLLVLALLAVLGLVPARFLGADQTPVSPNVAIMRGAAWTR